MSELEGAIAIAYERLRLEDEPFRHWRELVQAGRAAATNVSDPATRRRNLIQAGALIAAAIDALPEGS